MRRSLHTACVAACLAACAASGSAFARKHSVHASANRPFDYLLLVLSYGPDFCDQPTGVKDPRECGTGRKVGFVVHGLWPQAEGGPGPENCPGSPLNSNLIQPMLAYIPTESLIRHEWSAHGTCSGLAAAAYFAEVRQARDALKIPADLAQPASKLSLAPAQIEAKFAAANTAYPKNGFVTSCYGNGELQEMRICLTKALAPRACPVSLQDCAKPSLTILPVR